MIGAATLCFHALWPKNGIHSVVRERQTALFAFSKKNHAGTQKGERDDPSSKPTQLSRRSVSFSLGKY
jgi:hypothetical protein